MNPTGPDRPGARSTEWLRSTAALSRTTPRGLLLLGGRRDHVMLVPGAGPAVWELLAEARTGSTLIGAIAELFDVEETSIEDDILRLLADLAQRGLIRSP